jgi:predicted nucleic acid-binding protein
VTVVIDASALVALIASEPQGPAVATCVESWLSDGREIHAPALARYEIANALARQVADRRLSREDVAEAWLALEQLPISYHVLVDGPGVIDAAITSGGAAPLMPRTSLSPSSSMPSYGRLMGLWRAMPLA